jgi:hypothetical protein
MITAYGGNVNCTMWFLKTIEADDFDKWVEEKRQEHKEKCGCNARFLFGHI